VYSSRPKPWGLQHYAKWLIGVERGCTGVCRCRPTARRARQIIVTLQWAVHGLTLLVNTAFDPESLFPAETPCLAVLMLFLDRTSHFCFVSTYYARGCWIADGACRCNMPTMRGGE
ncbi:hypothetical protein K466DRAFT_490379, partial [Polyporus arcularius HHB13444]